MRGSVFGGTDNVDLSTSDESFMFGLCQLLRISHLEGESKRKEMEGLTLVLLTSANER